MKTQLDWQSATSSQIKRFAYELETKTMTIQFLTGGVYQYAAFPPEKFEEMKSAQSIGRFLGAEIKNKFEFKRVALAMIDKALADIEQTANQILIVALQYVRANVSETVKPTENGSMLGFTEQNANELEAHVMTVCNISFDGKRIGELLMARSLDAWAMQIATDLAKDIA